MAELRYIEFSFVFQECVILVESLKNRFHTKGEVSSFFLSPFSRVITWLMY